MKNDVRENVGKQGSTSRLTGEEGRLQAPNVTQSVDLLLLRFSVLQKHIASPGKGILAMDESNATCGLRLASIGLENTEENRKAYRTLLVTTPGIGEYCGGAILFEETLFQDTLNGDKMVDALKANGVMPGIKVDKVILLIGYPLLAVCCRFRNIIHQLLGSTIANTFL